MLGFVGVAGAGGASSASVARSGKSFVCAQVGSRRSGFGARQLARPGGVAPTCVLAEDVGSTVASLERARADENVRHDVRNIAIVAHVDHGKTTLVDALLSESKVFRDNQEVQERIMDSNDLERERGITILAKNTAINYKNTRLNIVDTPGHADFGGEVERVLNMVDGVLLLVDAVEGPKPQTRFVLKKALSLGLKVVVVVNKIDRPASRPEWVVDTTFDLFCELGATDEQTDFHTVYASALKGLSGNTPDSLEQSLQPVLDAILDLPKPKVNPNGSLQMMVSNIDYDDFKGRLAIGRIQSGVMRKQQTIGIAHPKKPMTTGKISEIMVFDNFGKAAVEEASAGDIVVLSGLSDIEIGDTIVAQGAENYLPPIAVEEPTVRMAFSINTSEFAGKEGKFVTSRNLRDRLFKELERNVALKVEPTDSADTFDVLGRGALHLTILIETMRREGYELMIGAPTVITKVVDGKKCEPFEEVEIEVQEEYMGAVVELFGRRKGEMLDMGAKNSEGMMTVNFLVPTRGLLGVKNALLTATRGNIVLNTQFAGFRPHAGEIETKDQGNLIAHETGKVTSFGLEAAQQRGRMFSSPGDEVYADQVVGIHQRPGDLKVNVCKKKALTNMRAASKDTNTSLQGVLNLSLDDAIEYITSEEVVEATPQSIRIKKVVKSRR
ncbi:putative elongation factor TypA-like SVR3, chloroplastic [Porphyridium purpureum]|uniref:Putative elongation factor TypA-like SVR3, chloroplastic n=1 Tax=Porphyridium purpureum TaxID=35688 RepID=A0A5J4Z5G6_PORPP|nr:putative elongation factor TypA-like SVR3, chloroplastic [Porphyridium purpureum]|eukprot:POR8966..scf295_1